MTLRLPRTALAVIALAGLLAAGIASADPRQDLHEAYRKFLALKSFRASMVDLSGGKTVMVVEFQAPDRYRMTMPGQPSHYVVGDTMVMSAGGRTMRVPLPKGTLSNYRNAEALRELERGSLVAPEGSGSVDGQPAKIYRHTTQVDGKPSQTLVWVGNASGLVLQVETRGARGGKDMRIRYSDFNSPSIRIEPPK